MLNKLIRLYNEWRYHAIQEEIDACRATIKDDDTDCHAKRDLNFMLQRQDKYNRRIIKLDIS